MQPELSPGASCTKLFEDKTPNAIILNRILRSVLMAYARSPMKSIYVELYTRSVFAADVDVNPVRGV